MTDDDVVQFQRSRRGLEIGINSKIAGPAEAVTRENPVKQADASCVILTSFQNWNCPQA